MNIYKKYLFDKPQIYSTPLLHTTHLKSINSINSINQVFYNKLYNRLYNDLKTSDVNQSVINKLTVMNTIVITCGLIYGLYRFNF
jgi:Mg2+ and Co2+ transporter CorA